MQHIYLKVLEEKNIFHSEYIFVLIIHENLHQNSLLTFFAINFR